MKRIAAILSVLAFPALAQEPVAKSFNGFSLELEIASTSPMNLNSIPTDAIKEADRICKSVGKIPEAQEVRKVSDFRYAVFYLCL